MDEQAEAPDGLNVTLLPHQRAGLAWMKKREKEKPCGGILADEQVGLIFNLIIINCDNFNCI
jgi:hypothetical protein